MSSLSTSKIFSCSLRLSSYVFIILDFVSLLTAFGLVHLLSALHAMSIYIDAFYFYLHAPENDNSI